MTSLNPNQNKPDTKTLKQQIFHPSLFTRQRTQSLTDCRTTQDSSYQLVSEATTQLPLNTVDTPWSEVPNRKRLRSSPVSNRVQKQSKTGTYWLSQPLPTSNSFAELENQEDDGPQTQKSEKQPKPPPIFIDKVTNIRPLTKLLEETVGGQFEIKVLHNSQVKIQPLSSEAFKTILKELDGKGTEYYTYKPKQERSFRVILKHIHPSTDTEEIKQALANHDHAVTNIWNMKQASTKKPLHMFVIDLQPNTKNKQIYDITSLLHCRIKFEPPRPKRIIPQCANCMAYGHTKSYCYRNPRCIKCAGDHASIDCNRKERSVDVKCALCDGNHPANYKGCNVFKELQKQKYPPLRNKFLPRKNDKVYNKECQPQTQPNSQNANYADAARTSTTTHQAKTSNPPEPQKIPKINQISSSEQVQPATRESTNDFTKLMDMFKQMMEQMTTMTNLLLTFMTELRSNPVQLGSSQDFVPAGGRRPTLPHRSHVHANH